MARFNGLTFWTDDFLADTFHLDAEETGAYVLLLMAAWRSPACDLPDDNKLLARYARCSSRRWALHMRRTMLPFWGVADGRWTQKRLTLERAATEIRTLKSSQAAQKRWSQSENRPASILRVGRDKLLNSNETSHANASSRHPPSICLEDASRASAGLGLESKKDTPLSMRARMSVRGEKLPPNGFDAWWTAYPKKVTRATALTAYAKALRSGATVSELLDALCRFQWPADPQYIPHASTWLGQGRWQDEAAGAGRTL